MARQPFTKVQSGEQLSFHAVEHNAMIDAAVALRRGRLATLPGEGSSHVITARVVNTTGGALPDFAVVKIGAPAVLPGDDLDRFQLDHVFEAQAPTATGQHAILEAGLDVNEVGDAIIHGVATVQVDVQDAGHTFASPIAADHTKLESGDAGPFRILYKEAGVGVKWAKVTVAATGGSTVMVSTLAANLLTTDINATIDDGMGGTFTADNTFDCCGDAGDSCAYWDDDGTMRLLIVQHKKVALTVEVRIQTGELEYVTRDFSVMTCGTAETEVKIADVGECI